MVAIDGILFGCFIGLLAAILQEDYQKEMSELSIDD